MGLSNISKVKGFTVMELLTVIVLFGILSTLFYNGLGIIQNSSTKIVSDFNGEMDIVLFMQQIENTVSNSDSIQFESQYFSFFTQDRISTLTVKGNQISYLKNTFNESLNADSIAFNIEERKLNLIYSFSLFVMKNQKEYHYLFSNKKRI